jgi:cation transport regulator ChaB
MPAKKEDLPGTLERSPKKIRRTYEKALDSAHEEYDSEQRAHRTAWSAVKHVAEKKGDHWEPKDGKGPSDPQARKSTPQSRRKPSKTYGGVDVEGQTKDELLSEARKLGVEGRSKMTKDELGEAIAKASRREDARRRRGS